MAALREILAVFDIKVNDGALQAADGKITGFVDQLKKLGAAFAGFAIVKSLVHFTEEIAANAREVEFHAGRMEMDTDAYQKLSQVAKDYGMTMENLQIANTLFTRALGNAGGIMGVMGKTTGHAAEAFRALGLDAKKFKGQKLEDILPQISDAMLKITDPMERVTTGLNLFGHRGRSIMPMMAAGGDSIRRSFAAALPVFEKATIETANEATLAGNAMSRTWQNLINNSFGKAAMVAFAKTADWLTKIGAYLKDLSKNSEIGKAVLISFSTVIAAAGVAALIAWAPVLVPVLGLIAAFTYLTYLMDDFIVFMKGGHSEIGIMFNDMFGPGGAEAIRKNINELWASVKTFFDDMNKALGSDFGKNFGKSMKVNIDELNAALRTLKEYMGWVLEKGGLFDIITRAHVSDAGPAANYGLPEVAKRLANTAPPPTLTGGSGPPSADQADKYGEMAYKAPAGMAPLIGINITTLDGKELAQKLKPVVEGVVAEHHRDAFASGGGAK